MLERSKSIVRNSKFPEQKEEERKTTGSRSVKEGLIASVCCVRAWVRRPGRMQFVNRGTKAHPRMVYHTAVIVIVDVYCR